MKTVKKRLVIAITGASGVIYGVRLLELIKGKGFETHLIVSEAGKKNIEIETGCRLEDIRSLADFSYENMDVGASLASGSFLTEAMVVVPCTITVSYTHLRAHET